jgi:hypothetical protein
VKINNYTFINILIISSLVSCGKNWPGSINSSSSSSSDSNTATPEALVIPSGIIHAFNLTTCPTGWTEYTPGKGRVLIGDGLGNIDGGGSNLTARTLGDTGGLEYKTALPFSSNAADAMTGDGNLLGIITGMYRTAGGGGATGLGGATTDSNLIPFISYLFCTISADSTENIPSNAILSQNNNSCAGDWITESNLSGRTIMGVGTGNLDANGAALTARSLADAGGREGVKGFEIGVEGKGVTATDTPAASRFLGDITSTYSSVGAEDGCLGSDGCLNDPNLAPFIVLNYCSLSSDSSLAYPSGSVAAFSVATCPSGWSDYEAGEGRLIIGKGSGNLDVDSVSLTTRSLGSIGGWEDTNSVPVTSSAANIDTAAGNILASVASNTYSTGALSGYTDTIADSNMAPFVTAHFCEKD